MEKAYDKGDTSLGVKARWQTCAHVHTYKGMHVYVNSDRTTSP